MNDRNSCEKCGNSLQINDPDGICPSCLMGHALQNDVNRPTMDATGLDFPRAEELVGCFPNLDILHLIGHGGMGAVYLARQKNLDRVVALKVLSPRLGNDPAFAERFIREAKTLAKLSHPNIVTVFDYGKSNNLNYLLMEYVDGINLRDAIQDGKLTPQESLAIIPQVCDALQFAHNAGVIHRDIKPENILLDSHGRVKIADFGLAKLLQSSQNEFSLTGTQQVLGTRNYMAPEQIEHPDRVDHRADIYSLGVVFYELLTGELPIGRFAVPSEKAPVTHGLDEIVLRTLEKEPARRFQQASEIRTAVETLGAQSSEPPPRPETASPEKAHSTLPFSISQLYGGLAVAHGIAHLYPDRLELEYEIVDDVIGAVKSSTHNIRIPLTGLTTVRFVRGVFSDRVEIQTDRLDAAKGVPNSKQGRFSLGTKRADLELARYFVDQINHSKYNSAEAGAMPAYQPQRPVKPQQANFHQPVPPRKSLLVGLGDRPDLGRQGVIEALKIPYIGFMAIGLIHLLLAIKGFVKAGNWQQFGPFDSNIIPGVDIRFFFPNLNAANLGYFSMFLVGILMLSIASRLHRPRNYTYLYAALIAVMLAPVHSAYVLTLVFAIWALVIINDPRCKNVYLAERNQAAYNYWTVGYFAAAILILAVAVASLLALAGLLFLGASQDYPQSPQSPDLPAAPSPLEELKQVDPNSNARLPGPENRLFVTNVRVGNA